VKNFYRYNSDGGKKTIYLEAERLNAMKETTLRVEEEAMFPKYLSKNVYVQVQVDMR